MSEARRASNPLDSDSSRGPQVDKMQLGGSRIGDVGYFVEPTILLDAPEDSKVMKEEIFGPVVCINTFTDEKDVIKLANDTEFGLFASVFTKDVSRAWRLAKALEAKAIGVNCTSPVGAMDVPVGGWKQSGDGREFGKYCTDYWTEVKAVFFAL
ncbi:uncharacterized protein PV06_10821 [Exophiala oligosperma]|uniref:aldehyde dehydrogenase (NAD(+)) n=1 Tax=Exophiala oligosperma TaxID=215243 RepID=A0A0D2BHK5_9EURO|nr:uncharacterized protein PV06_10821 [Exophiala oligosperma]KIW36917.1 hypothetical protein PV06_10821 [Exophiala oligosperma]